VISIVVPALDEVDELPRTLAAAARACPGAELIVVDGGSRDGTAAAANAVGARVVHAPRGRGTQLRAGVSLARGDVVIMLHADTHLPDGAGAAVRAALRPDTVAAGAFHLRFRSEGVGLPLSLRLLERWLNARSRHFGIVTGDQAIFAKTATLRSVGGVPDVPLFEDVRLLRALRRRGRVVLLEHDAATSPRLFVRHGAWRTAFVHLLFRLLHAAGVAPHRLAAWYPATAASGARSRSARRATTHPA
jgi:uncharacterized protein